MRSTEAVITEIVEAYNCRWGQWVRVAEIADKASLTREELTGAFEALIDEDEMFRAEPAAVPQQITDEDRGIAPVIGGEARHLVCWYA